MSAKLWTAVGDGLPVPNDGQRVWVAKAGTPYKGIATFDMFGACFFVGENDVTKDVTHWAPCEPPPGPAVVTVDCDECENGRWLDASHGCTRKCNACNGTGCKPAGVK